MAFSAKQREYLDNANKRWNFKTGATRSGKTYLDYYVIPKRIRARIGLPGLAVILGVTKSTIERNILEPMRNIWGAALVGEINSQNICCLFGERVYCLGAEKISQVSKLRGASIKYVYGDEVADWNPEVFQMLKSRLDKPYSCFDGALNPQGPNHWLKAFIESGTLDIYCQKYTIFDNPFLDPKFVENLCKEYMGSVYYQRYILGEWALAEGLIYPMFDTSVNVTEDADGPGDYYISIDYGTINPTAMGLWRVHKQSATMVKEYYHNSRETGKQKTDEEYYNDLVKFATGYKIKRIIIDPSAASFKELIRRKGAFVVMDAKNSVLDGIRFTSTMIGAGQLRIHASCKNTLREFGEYRWDDKAKDDAVIKENDHSMDQMRYLCFTLRKQLSVQKEYKSMWM